MSTIRRPGTPFTLETEIQHFAELVALRVQARSQRAELVRIGTNVIEFPLAAQRKPNPELVRKVADAMWSTFAVEEEPCH
ncbi:MAG: hypothetical protein R3F10_03555 [Lysobacteraceae bacterium]